MSKADFSCGKSAFLLCMVHVAAGGAFSVHSVHLDARPNHAGTLFKPFEYS